MAGTRGRSGFIRSLMIIAAFLVTGPAHRVQAGSAPADPSAAAAPATAATETEDGCAPAQDMTFVCGPANAEDLLWIPGTPWIVASGMSGEAGAGHLYLLDPRTREFQELYPAATPRHAWDRDTFAGCPGELDPTDFSAHGLSILELGEGRSRLYVTGHGAREAVEVFDVDSAAATPSVTWVGCVPMREHDSINSVAALNDGGFLTTRIASEDPESSADIFAGEITGFVYEWHPGGDLIRLDGTDMSGPNGIVISADQRTVYVASWGRGEVARFVRDDAGRVQHDQTVKLGFRVDNLRWTDAGTILAAGHRLAEKQDCGMPLCFDDWEIAEIDPGALTATTRVVREPMPGFLGATVALADRNGLWLGTFHGNRIAYVLREG